MRKSNAPTVFIAGFLILADMFVWSEVIFAPPATFDEADFLDVGQGDSELVQLGPVKILTDAGPDRKVLGSLEKVLSQGDRYIDLAVITHPQLDHFGGFTYLLDHYRFGAFIVNGRSDSGDTSAWNLLLQKIDSYRIPILTLQQGDSLRFGEDAIAFLSPSKDYLQSAELNDTGLVELVGMPYGKILLTADIDAGTEEYLLSTHRDLRADILKIAHHGSEYSSEENFLRAVDPAVAVVEVGARNTYGHPSPATLSRIASSTRARIFRTDKNGTVRMRVSSEGITVLSER